MFDTLSNFLVLSNFLTWVRDTQTFDWSSRSTQLTVASLGGVPYIFCLFACAYYSFQFFSVGY